MPKAQGWFDRMGRQARAIMLVAACIVLVSPQARAADLFTVRGVAVDVTAESAAVARDQALRNGQDEAWRRLLSRLTDVDPRFLPLDGGEAGAIGPDLTQLVANLDIANERTSDVRYVADLTVGFNEAAVRDYLIAQNISFVRSTAPPALLLPVQEVGDRPILWEETNLWREAWDAVAAEMVLQPIVVPAGDFADQALLSAEAAAGHDAAALAALAAQYDATDAIVAMARGGFDDGLGVARVDISVTRIGDAVTQPAFIETVYGVEEEAPADLYLRAARTVARQLSEAWKRDNLISVAEGGAFALVVPVEGLKDWLAKRRALEALPMLTRRDLVRLNRKEAALEIAYVGGLDQVQRALDPSGLVLEPVPETETRGFDRARPVVPRLVSPGVGQEPVAPLERYRLVRAGDGSPESAVEGAATVGED